MDSEDDLVFTVSSKADGKDRWTELEVVAYEAGNSGYEVTAMGCSARSDDWEHSKTKQCDTAQEVVEALRAPSGVVSQLAHKLLNDLAEKIEEFKHVDKKAQPKKSY